MLRFKSTLHVSALLALILPAPGLAAGAPPVPPGVAGGIAWLQAITDQTNQLVTANAGALVDIGYVELYFIGVFTLISMVARWQLAHMVIGFRPVNFAIGDLFLFLINLSLCSVMLHYYTAPFPGTNINFHQLPDTFARAIAGTLDTSILNDFLDRVRNAVDATNRPVPWNVVNVLIYFQVMTNMALADLVMFAVNAFGFVAHGIFSLFGPLVIPLYLTRSFRNKFWGWIDGLIIFAMYRAVAAGLSFIWLNVILGFFDYTVRGDYSLGHWLALLPTLFMLMGAFAWSMFKVPALTSMLFGGAGAGVQAATDTLTVKLAALAEAALA
jgi:type IV secretion system protein VirB6